MELQLEVSLAERAVFCNVFLAAQDPVGLFVVIGP